MVKANLGLRLRDKQGPEASHDLNRAFEEAQNDMLTTTAERREARLAAVASELRQDRPRFFFWVGQFTATIAVIGLLWRIANR